MSFDLHQLRTALTGISGILVTPYDKDDRIAPAVLRPIVDRAIAAGVHILAANGNTSEFYALTLSEAEEMLHAAAEHIGGRVPFVAGVGRSIHDACALTRTARAAGAAAILIHQPPDAFTAPRGVVAYVERVAEAGGGMPILLYLRDDGIGLEQIEALCRIPGIVGLKWASPTPLHLAEAIRHGHAGMLWICGLAETWAPPFYAIGARGFTSGMINVWPERSVAIHKALEAGNYKEAMELIAAVTAFEELRTQERNGTNVSIIKAALQLVGHDCGHVRPPGAWPLTKDQRDELVSRIEPWGLLAGAQIANH